MKKSSLLILLLYSSMLVSNSEMGCSVSELLEAPKSSLLTNIQENNCSEDVSEASMVLISKTAIREELMSVKVMHESKEILIEREVVNDKVTCPPFCIEPMSIEDVVTVGELEVLSFIDKLKEKKARLVIDVRDSTSYAEGTIPAAINLPFTMLEDKSKYQEEVLKLLGAKLNKKSAKSKWSFTKAQSLLIFGSSAISFEASRSVKKLLELGYPHSKLLYYRAGIESWKALGLTVY